MAVDIIKALLSSILPKVGELVFPHIQREISYVFKSKSHIEDLKKKVDNLKNTKQRLEHSIDNSKRQGDEIYENVEQWLKNANEFIERAEKSINEHEEEVKRKCFQWFMCPDLMMRYKLNKKAAEATKDCALLLQDVEQTNFQTISYRGPLRRLESINSTGTNETFGTRNPILKEIIEALKDANVNMIGIYGMGGVGKTTLVNEVASRVMKEKLFETVVIAEITQNPNYKRIQDKIAYDLGLKLEQESEYERVGRLCNRLKKEKTILIILDNIWAKLDLKAIGIPIDEIKSGKFIEHDEKESRKDDQMICKILLTSRNQVLLQNDMNTQKEFLVNPISNHEAKNLFGKMVGDLSEQPDFQSIAVKIIEKCNGLPLAITTMANALKNKNIFVWKDVLTRLEGSAARQIEGMDETVFLATELSYKFMKSDEAKSIFLLCSLHKAGHEIYIYDLLRFGIGLGTFQDAHTFEQKRNRVRALITDLKASCLLLDGDTNRTVKMHDMIHVVAASIASTEKHMLNIQNATDLEKELYKESIAISLHFKEITELPERLEFPKLKLFLLFEKYLSLQIPDLFFEETKELKILDFKGIHFSSLPSSFHCLTNLLTLSLEACSLGDIAIVGVLKKLEILNLSHSDIEQLPGIIGHLKQLKLLDLRNCLKLKVIAPKVLSSLSRLEELYMDNISVQWEEEFNSHGPTIASLGEMKKLSMLTNLHIHIRDAQIMPQDLFFEKLTSFKILIGDNWTWSDAYETSTTLKLKLSKSSNLRQGIKTLFKVTEDLYLDEMDGVQSVLYQLHGNGFPQLKHLHVQNNHELLYVVNSILYKFACFPMLKSLSLYNLSNLGKICNGPLHAEAFTKLRIINVEKCDRLKYLFSVSMAKNLSKLQEIEVTNCKNLEEIFDKESEGHDPQNEMDIEIEFNQLRSLTLQSLPQLISFIFISQTSFATYMRSKEITGDDKAKDLIALFSQKVLFSRLENLKLSSSNVMSIWIDQSLAMFSHNQTLTSLIVEECNGLKYLFSTSVVGSLVKLEKLVIGNCKSMKGVIETKGLGRKMKIIDVIFPRLLYLQLKDLPKLTRFGTGNLIEFPLLNALHIESCPNLKSFFSNSCHRDLASKEPEEMKLEECSDVIHTLFDNKVTFPSLEKMILLQLDNLQLIWHSQLHPDSFCNLKELRVEFCEKLMSFVRSSTSHLIFQNLEILNVRNCWSIRSLFPVSLAIGLTQLKELKIFNCGLEEIVAKEEIEKAPKFVLPKLSILGLHNLPELKRFYHGLHTTEWPMLKRLMVNRCFNIKVHASESLSFPRRGGNGDSHPVFFSLEKVMPNLEILFIDSHSITLKLLEQILAKSLSQLKDIRLVGFDDELVVFPFEFLGRLHSVERLVLSDCKFEELFPYQGQQLLQNLETLKVWRCDYLKCLMPSQSSATSFKNLSTLDIWSCNGLSEVLSSSTVKGLVQLTELRIRDCNSVREIIAREDKNVMEDEIVFDQLKSLELHLLPSLSCFSSTSNAVRFPCLEGVVMQQCPEMKLFSNGVLSTPMLKRVQLTEQEDPEYFWKNDLNSTVQQLFVDMVGYPDLEHLKLSDFPRLKQIWHGQPPMVVSFFRKLKSLLVNDCSDIWSVIPAELIWHLNNLDILDASNCDSLKQVFDLERLNAHGRIYQGILCFNNLKSLKVYSCNSLTNVFTPSLISAFAQLQEIEIINCLVIEEIITKEGEEDATLDKVLIPQIKSIMLKSLPNLTSFYSGSKILECPSLRALTIEDCQKMKTFVFTNISAPLLNDKLGYPSIEHLKLSEYPLLKEIWHGQPPMIVSFFQNLRSLMVDKFSDISSVIPAKLILHLNNLEMLEASNCDSLIQVFDTEAIIDHGRMYQKVLFFNNLKSLKICSCRSLRYVFSTSLILALVQLQEIEITDCAVIEEIISKEAEHDATADKILIPRINSITLKSLPNLRSFYPGSNTLEFPCLKALTIKDCQKMETFVFKNINAPLLSEKVGNPNLEQLKLSEFPRLKEIWQDQPPMVASFFHNLRSLVVDESSEIQSAVPAKLIWHLNNLETLDISKCDSLKQVFDLEGLNAHGHVYQKISCFNNLKSLKVHSCTSLRYIFTPSVILALVQLQKIETTNCAMIEEIIKEEGEQDATVDTILMPQVKSITLKSLPNLTSFYSGSNILECPYLEAVTIEDCHKMETFTFTNIIAPFFRQKLGYTDLKHLKLSDFPHLKEIWHGQPPMVVRFFHNLRSILVDDCADIWSAVPTKLIWHLNNLEILEVVNCGSMIQVFDLEGLNADRHTYQKILCFNNLKSLKLHSCNSLRYIFTTSLISAFKQLQEIEITSCAMIEEVITGEGEQDTTVDQIINIPQVNSITLSSLPKLGSFYSGSNNLECPSLKAVTIKDCQRMEAFVFSNINAPLVNEKVGYHIPEQLKLSENPHLKEIWHGQPPMVVSSFHNLRSLVVEECSDILSAIPVKLIRHLDNLEMLDVSNCDLLKHVFDLEGPNADGHMYQNILCFNNLKSLKVHSCTNLRYIFTLPLILALVQLQEIEIRNCGWIEEIITMEGENDEVVDKIIMPKVNSITLKSLPNLTCFYSGSNILECTSLKSLTIKDCPKMESFVFTNVNAPLFNEKIAFPSLEELRLEWNDNMTEMWHEKFSEQICKLKVLEVIGTFPVKASIFPSSFFHTSCNLEKLVVSNAFFKEIFLCEGLDCEERHAEALSKLRDLKLSELPECNHLWKENSQPSKAFQNLMTLEVSKCGKLENLVPSTVSFQKLFSLEVSKCDRLKILMTFSTAKSLMKLTKMIISDCKKIREIIELVGYEAEDQIVFSQLKYLELHYLPSLRSFYSGNSTLVFPSLEQVILKQCPNMVIFSEGVSSSPKLQRIQLTEEDDKGRWEGNLNSTIQQLFKEKIIQSSRQRYLAPNRF